MKFFIALLIVIGTSLIDILFVETQKSCESLLKKIRAQSRAPAGNVPMPPISCLVCSLPLCVYEEDMCYYQSGLPGIPLYQNVLEFGLVSDYVPNNTEIFIHHNSRCNVYINIFKIGEKQVRITYNECVKGVDSSNCSSFSRPYDDVLLDAIDNCVQIGLIFKEKKKVYLAYSNSCKYVATVFYNSSNFISLLKQECAFNARTDKPIAYFRFSQEKERESFGVPLALPCTPGGYVVDPGTRKFYVNQSCLDNFGGSDLYSPYKGFLFAILKIYDDEEEFIFPSRDFDDFEFNPNPIYIKENRNVASREEMAPEIIPWELRINQTRRNCYLINVAGKRDYCRGLPFTRNFEELWKKDPYYSKYAPRFSCIVCAEPECNYYHRNCKKYAKTNPIPVYNNLLEFGLFGISFPAKVFVRVALNEFCYLKVEIVPVFITGLINIFIYECLFSDKNCLIGHYMLRGNFTYIKECMFFALGFGNSKYINIGFSVSCLTLASATICDQSLMTLRQEACYFDTSKENLIAEYRFLQDKSRIIDGVAVMLPCTTGGFVVDPETGRFVTGDLCKSLYWEDRQEEGLEYIIRRFYNNNENLLFPTDSPHPFHSHIPFYIATDGESIPAQDLKPVVRIRSEKFEARKQCSLLSFEELKGYNASINSSLLKAPNLPHGVTAMKTKQSKRHFDQTNASLSLKEKAMKLNGDSSTKETGYASLVTCILTRILIEMHFLQLHFYIKNYL